eukprot:s1942_g2.t1
MLSIYPFMLMLRLLKSFDAQPRLAIITETLREASQEHTGCDLGNFGRALHFAFRIVFDEFDDKHFKKLERVSRPAAYVWFTAFEVMVVIILLNMLLAIIMDNYMMVKKRARLRQSLLHQIQELWRRWRMNRRKERVQLKEILGSCISSAQDLERFCRGSCLESQGDVSERPAAEQPLSCGIDTWTLHNSWTQHLQETEAPFAVSEAHESLADLESSTRCIRNNRNTPSIFFAEPSRTDDLVTDTQEKAIFKLAMNEAIEEEEELAGFTERAKREEPEKDSERTVVAFVEDQTARLSSEAAETLAQALQSLASWAARRGALNARFLWATYGKHHVLHASLYAVSERVTGSLLQIHIEQREDAMTDAVRQMHARLLQLRSDAAIATRRLEKALYIREQRNKGSSAWRKRKTAPVSVMIESSFGSDQAEFGAPTMELERLRLSTNT